MVKNPLAMQETWVWSLSWEDFLEKGMTTHPVFFLENPHGQIAMGCGPQGHKESDTTEQLSRGACGEGKCYPLQSAFLGDSRTGKTEKSSVCHEMTLLFRRRADHIILTDRVPFLLWTKEGRGILKTQCWWWIWSPEHPEKHWTGRNTSWNQDCREKYQ